MNDEVLYLRMALDDDGIAHRDAEDKTVWAAGGTTWCASAFQGGLRVQAMDTLDAQGALAATGTRGACHAVLMDCFGNRPYNTSGLAGNSTAYGCSECGVPWSTMGAFRGNPISGHNFRACPICGRKVKADV